MNGYTAPDSPRYPNDSLAPTFDDERGYLAQVAAEAAPLATPTAHPAREAPAPAGQKKKESIAEQLVRLALHLYRFGRTEKDEPFAVARVGANLMVPIKGSASALRATLAREFRRAAGKTAAASSLSDAITVLTGEALDAEPETVHQRTARHDNAIVLDIGDRSGRAVVVSPSGWQVVERSPILFRRSELTSALPIPERGGRLDELRELLNVTEESWPLVLGWLLAAYIPDIPHAILLLSGLQGSGKSSLARVLVSLFDPSPALVRCVPRNVDDWQVAAAGSWAVTLDNISSIAPWLADALCRAATGDGLAKRKLYTDADVAVLAFRRVIALTSIDPGALRGDLGERLIVVDLEALDASVRRTEHELDAEFMAARGRLCGALLDALVQVLARLPTTRPKHLPRMADFGRFLAAADAAGVTEDAYSRFLGQQGRIARDVLDSDSFGTAVAEFATRSRDWQGTATQVLDELARDVGRETRPREWPAPNRVKGYLKRLTPSLRECGIAVTFDRAGTGKRDRLIRLTAEGRSPADGDSIVPTVPKNGEKTPSRDDGDGRDGHLPIPSSRVQVVL